MMNRIVSNPKILGGKPVIRGTRLSVEFILNRLASGASEKEILENYPRITLEDIHACLAFAANSLKNNINIELEFEK
jgi:uncharacterized protein (DUF433 family)